jgi:hypothetical protein
MQYVGRMLNRAVAGVAQIKLTDVKTPDETEPINSSNDRARMDRVFFPELFGK